MRTRIKDGNCEKKSHLDSKLKLKNDLKNNVIHTCESVLFKVLVVHIVISLCSLPWYKPHLKLAVVFLHFP